MTGALAQFNASNLSDLIQLQSGSQVPNDFNVASANSFDEFLARLSTDERPIRRAIDFSCFLSAPTPRLEYRPDGLPPEVRIDAQCESDTSEE